VERRLATDGEADEGRRQREGDERPDRQAEPLTPEVDADDGDSRREPPHQRTKVLAARFHERRA
jgi:hypothetical protein